MITTEYCDFQGNTCLKSRNVGTDRVHCCKGCHRHKGHFKIAGETFPEEYRHLLVEDYGFLTVSGCALPREARSSTCTEYLCKYVLRKIAEE